MPPKRPPPYASPRPSTSIPQSSLRQPPSSDVPVAAHPKVVSFRRSSDAPIEEYISEQSPLIRPRSSHEDNSLLKVVSPVGSDEWEGDVVDEETKSSFFLFLLTLGGLGLQIGWSVETSNGSVSLVAFLGSLWHTTRTARPNP